MKEEILIVEDDVDISGLLKRILEDAGYETKQAYSGTEALLCCEKNSLISSCWISCFRV